MPSVRTGAGLCVRVSWAGRRQSAAAKWSRSGPYKCSLHPEPRTQLANPTPLWVVPGATMTPCCDDLSPRFITEVLRMPVSFISN